MHMRAALLTGYEKDFEIATIDDPTITSPNDVIIKGGLQPVDVAPLGDAGLTAYRAVRKALPLATPGTRTVVRCAGAGQGLGRRPHSPGAG
jgi:D-arabinose 1-dehydrogenase-like Zn-dependent alcohol dehydrogenase